jgi:two-component system chemotaxis response regulator CheB
MTGKTNVEHEARDAKWGKTGQERHDGSKIVRALVIDDSAFMRKALTIMLESDPGIQVVATARDGEEGIAKLTAHHPDVVTLDIEMPRMAGLATLEWIMKEHPVPVLMVSSQTRDGAEITLRALELGAADFVAKTPGGGLEILQIQEEVVRKALAVASQWKRRVAVPLPATLPRAVGRRSRRVDIVAVGSSTGGPQALQALCSSLPSDFPCGLLVVQHMPPAFTGPLAQRLNGLSPLTVLEASQGTLVEAGTVLVAPGGSHMLLRRHGLEVRVELSEEPRDLPHRPSVDVMFTSAAQVFGGRSLGVILTGMGNDGLQGCRALKAAGGRVLAQDEESSVVYGMPRAVAEADLADQIVPLAVIPETIVSSL